MTPPTLATREQVPTAWFLITVGNISAVYTYTMAKEAEALRRKKDELRGKLDAAAEELGGRRGAAAE